MRKQAPGAAAPYDVEDGVKDLVYRIPEAAASAKSSPRVAKEVAYYEQHTAYQGS